jgi:hypothetical protein
MLHAPHFYTHAHSSRPRIRVLFNVTYIHAHRSSTRQSTRWLLTLCLSRRYNPLDYGQYTDGDGRIFTITDTLVTFPPPLFCPLAFSPPCVLSLGWCTLSHPPCVVLWCLDKCLAVRCSTRRTLKDCCGQISTLPCCPGRYAREICRVTWN